MNYVEHFNLFGVEAKEVPCIKHKGEPTTSTEGAVGCLYMDTDTGAIYKCVCVADGAYVWESMNGSMGNAVVYAPQALTDEEKAQARANIGAASKQDAFTIAPRAQIKQIRFFTESGEDILFEDVYAFDDADQTSVCNRCRFVYGLEVHKTNSTTQRIFRSMDGGQTWSEYASLSIDAADGVWYTDLFVDAYNALKSKKEVFYLLKTTDGFAGDNNVLCSFAWNGQRWNQNGSLELGSKRWLGNNNSIAVANDVDGKARATIFGEYGTTTNGETYCLWRTINDGARWEKVLELGGDYDGVTGNGEIRHWHSVFVDPYTKHWWASSGDTGEQCRIYRSVNNGAKWVLMFSGTQRERTCGFVFEQDCIYYGMDAGNNQDVDSIKIVKIDKSMLGDTAIEVGENIFDYQSEVENGNFVVMTINEEEYFTSIGYGQMLDVSFEPNTQYVFSLEATCPDLVNLSDFDGLDTQPFTVNMLDAEGTLYSEYIGSVNEPYDGVYKCEYTSPPDLRVADIVMNAANGTVDGAEWIETTFWVKKNMTIRAVKAQEAEPVIPSEAREDVAVVDGAPAVYGLTRTATPDGFIVWTQREPGTSAISGRYVLLFYDYSTKELYPLARFDTSEMDNESIGFFAGARVQNVLSGVIFAKPTRCLQQGKYGDAAVSTHVKLNLTC